MAATVGLDWSEPQQRVLEMENGDPVAVASRLAGPCCAQCGPRVFLDAEGVNCGRTQEADGDDEFWSARERDVLRGQADAERVLREEEQLARGQVAALFQKYVAAAARAGQPDCADLGAAMTHCLAASPLRPLECGARLGEWAVCLDNRRSDKLRADRPVAAPAPAAPNKE